MAFYKTQAEAVNGALQCILEMQQELISLEEQRVELVSELSDAHDTIHRIQSDLSNAEYKRDNAIANANNYKFQLDQRVNSLNDLRTVLYADRSQKITLIKAIRALTNLGLREVKDFVEEELINIPPGQEPERVKSIKEFFIDDGVEDL